MSAASSGESLIDQETLLQLVGFGSSSAFIEWASGASSSERLGIAALVVALAEGGAN
jgi:xanthine/uracil/vitamin C permease (AzgA family)